MHVGVTICQNEHMKLIHKYYIWLLAVFTILASSYLVAHLVNQSAAWKSNKAREILMQSQKESDSRRRLLLLLEVETIEPSDQTSLKIAMTADSLNIHDVARKALDSIGNSDVLLDWPVDNSQPRLSKILAVYGKLTPSYPHSASRLLLSHKSELQSRKDALLTLSEDYFVNGDYHSAETYVLKAREIDQYFPQTYEQLVKVENKLNKTDEAEKYEHFLKSLTW